MLNRILGRTKAKDLTAEEIEQVAGAGCWTEYTGTYVHQCYYPPNYTMPWSAYEADMDDEMYCDDYLASDPYSVCN